MSAHKPTPVNRSEPGEGPGLTHPGHLGIRSANQLEPRNRVKLAPLALRRTKAKLKTKRCPSAHHDRARMTVRQIRPAVASSKYGCIGSERIRWLTLSHTGREPGPFP